MNVDEMDLARQALDVTPWRPEEYERARAVLRAAMAESGSPDQAAAPVGGSGSPRAPRRRRLTMVGRGKVGTVGTVGKVGIGAGIAAIAAAAAVALVSTSVPAPAPSAHQAAASGGPAAASTAAGAKLATLAALIQTSDAPLPGNASLVIARQVNGGRLMQVVYALYTDSGRLYLGDDKQTLMAEVADNANQADFTNAREIAAARYAATGNLAAAVRQMVEALPNDYYDSLAERKAIWAKTAPAREQLEKEKGVQTPIPMPTGRLLQQDIDNTLWTASTIALSWGAGDPQIRVGVLRLLSTLPDVTVVDSTTDGQPTLTITAGPALFGAGSGDQVLTVNARTGIPVSSVESGGGLPTAVQTDRVSRVTVAAIKAGKF
jgi:hypothetical protein